MRTSDLLNERTEAYLAIQAAALRHGHFFDDILGALESAGIEPTRAAIGRYCFDLSFTGDRTVLNKAFGILRSFHMQPNSRPTRDSEYYTHWYSEDDDNDLQIWFTFTSTQCRKVVTGVRLVEEEIYEIVCDEGESE